MKKLKTSLIQHVSFLNEKKVHSFLVSFYVVAVFGFAIPHTRDLFIMLTKWALLFNIGILFYYHKSGFSNITIVVFSMIVLWGYVVEVIGVNTGAVFGKYTYETALGITLFDTPLLIGVNWLMLTYLFASVVNLYCNSTVFIKSLLGALGMLVYDFFLETICHHTKMWFWQDAVVPLKNYVAWFVIAFVFHLVIHFFKIQMKNPVAITLLFCQMGYVVALSVFFNVLL